MLGRPGCDFSFSGLKTAVRRHVEALAPERVGENAADLSAAFQVAVGDILVDRCRNAIRAFRAHHPEGRHLVIAGGVAANGYLRQRLVLAVASEAMTLVAPPLRLCTDNAVMIAWAGWNACGSASWTSSTSRHAPAGPSTSRGSAMSRVGIIGAGAWGTALAVAAVRAGHDVRLWGHQPDLVGAVNADRENRRYLAA